MSALEGAAESLLTGAGVAVGPSWRQRASHKIVFEYADSDDEEGTTTQIRCEDHALTVDRDDLEDPVERAKREGDFDGDLDAPEGTKDSHDFEFVEDAAVMTPMDILAGITARSVPLPTDLLPIPPRAADARVRTLRVAKTVAVRPVVPQSASAEGEDATLMQDRERPDDADDEDGEPRPLTKRDRDVKVTNDGYHLTTDERDLVYDWATGITRAVRRPPRPEFAALLAGTDPAMPAAAGAPEEEGALGDDDDNDDNEEDEEEDEEDAEMDDLLLVASVERMMTCCKESISTYALELHDASLDAHRRMGIENEMKAMREFVETASASHAKLLADDMTPLEFGLEMRPLIGRVYGAMKRSERPPKNPIIIDGKLMDM
jgi:hypothetical protein